MCISKLRLEVAFRGEGGNKNRQLLSLFAKPSLWAPPRPQTHPETPFSSFDTNHRDRPYSPFLLTVPVIQSGPQESKTQASPRSSLPKPKAKPRNVFMLMSFIATGPGRGKGNRVNKIDKHTAFSSLFASISLDSSGESFVTGSKINAFPIISVFLPLGLKNLLPPELRLYPHYA